MANSNEFKWMVGIGGANGSRHSGADRLQGCSVLKRNGG